LLNVHYFYIAERVGRSAMSVVVTMMMMMMMITRIVFMFVTLSESVLA